MIRINDDWLIDVDQYNYIVKRDTHKMVKARDGKAMVPGYTTMGYYGSLRKALEALGEEMVRDRLAGDSLSLAEALQTVRECKEKWDALVRKAVGE